MSRLPGKSNTADKITIKALRNEIKRRASQAKYVMVIVHDREGVRMSLQYGVLCTPVNGDRLKRYDRWNLELIVVIEVTEKLK